MTWTPYYRGNQSEGERPSAPVELPPLPPWRQARAHVPFEPPLGLAGAVNAALLLRRPLLLTGSPGAGKSTVALSIAQELGLGGVLRWHITSRSTLVDALYRYDALGRLHARQHKEDDSPERFLRLGPLGTALAAVDRPRVLLIDEIDKSDIDLPSDLLDVLERGSFEIDVLKRHTVDEVRVRLDVADGEDDVADDARCTIARGVVRGGRDQFPVIVMTSNGEREFPPPFLRRCVRFPMPDPDSDQLTKIVNAHLKDLDEETQAAIQDLIKAFAGRIGKPEVLATDQLLNAVYLVTREFPPEGDQREQLVRLLTKDLSSA
ncbi:AAA family ATPase [Frankia sp. CNm7]|uniref:AAA family ATPase n=1 Tax=Frankia nepalensis TaxID=1836974 RepID=A0A937RHG5_9ACTN|nr:AAA family ATPase [Frankia nepalensis]MBL7496192.1 AAA family ATPase [Frankia nepalensis]MBL7511602.1 AAA family ATPase [Frankia nepalensis]MBL7520628.1 AAA family ATPase [Frankia nepalensis]MBL7630277.1 AAA family ATPase [Frankia nepalensis]